MSKENEKEAVTLSRTHVQDYELEDLGYTFDAVWQTRGLDAGKNLELLQETVRLFFRDIEPLPRDDKRKD